MKTTYLFLIGLLMTACSAKTQPGDARTDETTRAEGTEVTADSLDAMTSATAKANPVTFNGTITVSPAHRASVTLTVGGVLKSTSMLPGHYVRRGTVIATLENPDFIALQQTYLDAHAQTEYLSAEYERQQFLTKEEAASQKKLQQAKADFLSMKSRRDAASAQLSLLGVRAEDLLRTGIRPLLQVHAPISGYVAEMHLNVGKYVQAGEPLCQIIDKSQPLICLSTYEKDLAGIHQGAHIVFRVNGMGTQTFEAVIASIGQEVDPTNRSIEVYADIVGSQVRFRPGMYVTARLKQASH